MANATVDQLNHLVEINKDGEAGFKTAAENIRNSEMQTLLLGYAGQHARFGSDLIMEIERLGGRPVESGTVGGALHRGWMDVKSALTGHSVASMLTACETGEQTAESAYLDVMEANPSGQTHTLLNKHCEQIKGFHTRLTRLVGELKDGVKFKDNAS